MSSVFWSVVLVASNSQSVYSLGHFTDPHFASVVVTALDPRWQLAQRHTPT